MSKKTKKILFWVVYLALIGVFLYSAISLVDYIKESRQAAGVYDDLQQLASRPTRPLPTRPAETEPTRPTETVPGETEPTETQPTETEPVSELVTVTDPKTGKEMQILPEFAELYLMNQDLVGWIEIPGTNVNYPVVQTPDRKDYYLRRDFYGNSATHGCIYVRESCDVNLPSDNVTIYGHRMNDGTMFAALANYKSKIYFNQHRYIYFDTLTERHTYEIVVVFRTTATQNEGFRYNLFENAETAEEFDQYIKTCKSLAYFDSEVTAEFGDKLITLSTCEYSTANGRLVVVAKRID